MTLQHMYQLSSFIQAAQHHTFAEHLYSVPEIILDKVLRHHEILV